MSDFNKLKLVCFEITKLGLTEIHTVVVNINQWDYWHTICYTSCENWTDNVA